MIVVMNRLVSYRWHNLPTGIAVGCQRNVILCIKIMVTYVLKMVLIFTLKVGCKGVSWIGDKGPWMGFCDKDD